MDYVVVVGFHHTLGSVVEYTYPESDLSTCVTNKLTALSLPDGSHLTDAGYVYFSIHNGNTLYHCVSCFRQIRATDVQNKSSDVSRSFI